jgi:malate synthase
MAARRKTAKKKTAKRKLGKAASSKKARKLAASSRARTAKKAAKRTAPKRAKAKPARRPVAKKQVAKPAARKPAPTTKAGRALPAGVSITGAMAADVTKVLTQDAIAFVVELERKFGAERKQLLARRKEVQAKLDAGAKPDFLAETAKIRAADWKVAPLPKDLLDRRVEITGPVDRKMIINALNSGANVFMADFEDSSTPTWANMIEGQSNLRDAVAGTITFTDPVSKKFYKPNDKIATLLVRPRGWHLPEKHVLVDGQPMSGSLFDFGLYVFHNAKALLAKGSGPYFYLPKMESHLEARLWNKVFVHAQDKLGIKRGSIKATVLIETILASF